MATEIVIGLMSMTSSRLLRLPVMHTLDPPSIICVVLLDFVCIVIEGKLSLCKPQMRGEHTTWVTLSVMVGRSGSPACVELGLFKLRLWSARRLTETVVGDADRVNASMRQPGGHGLMTGGGGSGGGGVTAGSKVTAVS
jgi:hypothetical protein